MWLHVNTSACFPTPSGHLSERGLKAGQKLCGYSVRCFFLVEIKGFPLNPQKVKLFCRGGQQQPRKMWCFGAWWHHPANETMRLPPPGFSCHKGWPCQIIVVWHQGPTTRVCGLLVKRTESEVAGGSRLIHSGKRSMPSVQLALQSLPKQDKEKVGKSQAACLQLLVRRVRHFCC